MGWFVVTYFISLLVHHTLRLCAFHHVILLGNGFVSFFPKPTWSIKYRGWRRSWNSTTQSFCTQKCENFCPLSKCQPLIDLWDLLPLFLEGINLEPSYQGQQKNRVTLATANKDRVALHRSLEYLLLLLWGELLFTLTTNIVTRGQQDNPG